MWQGKASSDARVQAPIPRAQRERSRSAGKGVALLRTAGLQSREELGGAASSFRLSLQDNQIQAPGSCSGCKAQLSHHPQRKRALPRTHLLSSKTNQGGSLIKPSSVLPLKKCFCDVSQLSCDDHFTMHIQSKTLSCIS